MNTLFLFSNNINKIKEIKYIFKNIDINIISLQNFPKLSEPIENGESFADNAKIKSAYGYNSFRIPCFADDSGICISALKNKPGVKSKRFLEKFENKKDAFKYIIKKTFINKNNKAFFVTNICLTLKKGHYILFEGKIHGKISDNPRGKNGFGYDPIFIPSGYKKTFAEMSSKEKNLISHRGLAVKKLFNFLEN